MTKVIVTIIGTQRDAEGDPVRIELVTSGRWYEKNGVRYIIYEDSEISGLEGTTTMLKVYEEHVVLVRMGKVEYRQEFRLGKRSVSSYITSYGTMQMAITTSQINLVLNSTQKTIDIAYDLEINGQWQSFNTLSVTIREEG